MAHIIYRNIVLKELRVQLPVLLNVNVQKFLLIYKMKPLYINTH